MKSIRLLVLMLMACSFSVFAHDQIPTDANDVRPIMVGQKVPAANVINAEGKTVSLQLLLAKKPSLVIFYRGGWCPYCNTHLAELRKIEQPLKSKGFQVIAVSPDLPKYLKVTGSKHKLGYTLVSDAKAEAIKALGLAFEMEADMLKKYAEYGIDLEKNSGEKHHLLPVPAALLIDTDGTVVFNFVSPNYKVRVSNNVIMAAADAYIATTKD